MAKLKITLIKSLIGRLPKHRQTAYHLGLRRMHQTVVKDDTASINGMVDQIRYLVQVEEC
ncbi:MAG: 50S ribosomal protein L30 [Legionellales bacterium]|nr:50S ribosomal protein L30 [Legionellales bacterium]